MGNWIGPRADPDLMAMIKLLAPARNQTPVIWPLNVLIKVFYN